MDDETYGLKDVLKKFAIDVAGKEVLEIGTGNGFNAINLIRLGANLTGIDPGYGLGDLDATLEYIEQVCGGNHQVTLSSNSVELLAKRGKKYPVVVSFQAFPKKEDWQSYLHSAATVTEDTGVTLIMTDDEGIKNMPSDVAARYFNSVERVDFPKLDYKDEGYNLFVNGGINNHAFICKGPKREVVLEQKPALGF